MDDKKKKYSIPKNTHLKTSPNKKRVFSLSPPFLHWAVHVVGRPLTPAIEPLSAHSRGTEERMRRGHFIFG